MCVFKFQKIITRKILIVEKKFTYKKALEYHFLLEKKFKKGVQNRREGVYESDSTIEPKNFGSFYRISYETDATFFRIDLSLLVFELWAFEVFDFIKGFWT